MTENAPNFEGKMKKEDAINDAVIQQDLLYAWPSHHLRDTKSFDKAQYDEAWRTTEHLREIQKEVTGLPAEGPQCTQQVINLAAKYGSEHLVIAWRELIDERADFTPRVKKFIDQSALLFSRVEKDYQDLSEENEDSDSVYPAPSNRGIILMSRLYDKISGRDYDTPEELEGYFKQALEGKKILEIAPGPGWLMKVLKDLGANVSGIEKNDTNDSTARSLGLDIKYADAASVNLQFSEQFDIVLSNNFFSQHVMKDYNSARLVLNNSNRALKNGGLALHCVHRPKYPKDLICLLNEPPDSHALVALRSRMELLRPEEQAQAVYPSQPALQKYDLDQVGKNVEYSQSDNTFTMAYYKP